MWEIIISMQEILISIRKISTLASLARLQPCIEPGNRSGRGRTFSGTPGGGSAENGRLDGPRLPSLATWDMRMCR